jgi:hypothetical protein
MEGKDSSKRKKGTFSANREYIDVAEFRKAAEADAELQGVVYRFNEQYVNSTDPNASSIVKCCVSSCSACSFKAHLTRRKEIKPGQKPYYILSHPAPGVHTCKDRKDYSKYGPEELAEEKYDTLVKGVNMKITDFDGLILFFK